MTAERMWMEFQPFVSDAVEYEAWSFGADKQTADELSALVLSGVKTATASAYPLYVVEKEPLPTVGAYSVILDGEEQAVCIIRTTKVTVVPYREVDARHAFCEGEGDRSLAYWREVHEKFFTNEMTAAGLDFDEKMPVVLEEFELVYPK